MELEELKNLLNQEEQNEQIDLKVIFQKYVTYWKSILGSIAICLILAGIYYLSKPNIYFVNGAVLVNADNENSPGNMGQSFSKMSGFEMFSGTNNVENEIEIIKSRDIMLGVIDSLELHTTYSTKKLLKKINLYSASPYIVNVDRNTLDTLSSSIQLKISKQDDGVYLIKTKYKEKKENHFLRTLPGSINLTCGKVNISLNRKNKEYQDPITVDVLIIKPLIAAIALSKQVGIELVSKQVNVVSLTYNIDNIKQGLDVLNTIITLYNDDSIKEKNKTLNQTDHFLSTRLDILKTELKQKELEVQTFKETNQLTDISADINMIMEQNTQFTTKRIEVENQLNIIDYVEEFIHDKSNKEAFIPNLGLTDVGLVAVIGEYNKLVIQKQTSAKEMLPENPSMIKLEAHIEAIFPAIKKSINNVRNAYKITNKDFNDQYDKTLTEMRSLPRKEREYIDLKRELEIKQQLYQFLLQRQAETSLSKQVTMPVSRFIETPASDMDIVSPKKMIIFGIAFALGLILPIITIFIYGLINTRIYSKDELEKLSSIPILGEIPKHDGSSIVVDAYSNTVTNELFRLLRSNLQFVFNPDTQAKKVILVSSSQPGEGKTFISVNLALSLSLSKKRVLLVGADIRKPRLAETLEIPKNEGLTSILSGEKNDYKTLLKQIPDYPNLDILQGGIIPPNPNELLLSERVDILFNEFRLHYDYIIVDTAPIGVVSDTFLLNRISDIMLFVVRSGVTTKEQFEILTSSHKRKQIKAPYIVLNDINYKSKEYSYRSKHSHQAYGYGEQTAKKRL